jgi:sugar lactone lactonase YvrE
MNKATQPEAYVEHDSGSFSPADVRVVATWPVGSFAENLTVHPDGSVFVSLHTPQRIDRYDPISGRTTPFADLPAPGMGLAFDAGGTLWATGGAFTQGPGYVWRVAQDGTIRLWTDLPDTLFINGCTIHPDGKTLLACESMPKKAPTLFLSRSIPAGLRSPPQKVQRWKRS